MPWGPKSLGQRRATEDPPNAAVVCVFPALARALHQQNPGGGRGSLFIDVQRRPSYVLRHHPPALYLHWTRNSSRLWSTPTDWPKSVTPPSDGRPPLHPRQGAQRREPHDPAEQLISCLAGSGACSHRPPSPNRATHSIPLLARLCGAALARATSALCDAHLPR